MVGAGPTLLPPGPRRGDIHWVAFPDSSGLVIAGAHPAVVVQTPAMSRSSTVMVVPMTSKSRSGPLNPPYLVAVSARESGLSRDGWIKADQIVTIDVAELGDRAGRLSPNRLAELDAALRFVLAL
ncbi:MAG TPA: type II toxin-antitoxin system PemK/MazF family toxin [Candidatus Limnocylindrales bacterium]